jgi:uncharacterized protein YdhG (YjbR/CyaY superfamily)
MAKKPTNAEEYVQQIPESRRNAIDTLRKLILNAAPDIVETFRYKMPTYIYKDEMLAALASQKHYMSLYMDTETVESYQDQLTGLNCGKSCIRFKKLSEVPIDVIEEMLAHTMKKRG